METLKLFTDYVQSIKSTMPYRAEAVNCDPQDDVYGWLKENTVGEWRQLTFRIYFFELEKDAVLFKLRFG